MTACIYPPEVYQKALILEGAGKDPVRIDLTIPTITVPDEGFSVKLALTDASGFASATFNGAVIVTGVNGEKYEISFKAGQPAVGLISGLRISQTGIYRLSTELNGQTFYSNPTCCRKNPEYRIFWGDPHVHTHLSDCHPERCRSAHFGYIAGRWQAGLDFVGMADHVSWGIRITPGKWRTQVATSELHDDPQDFVTLPGYEVSLQGGRGGDNNVYTRNWPETWVDDWENGTNKTLAEKVEKIVGKENYFVVPHHTSRGGGKTRNTEKSRTRTFPEKKPCR